jgi:hypothetical protein
MTCRVSLIDSHDYRLLPATPGMTIRGLAPCPEGLIPPIRRPRPPRSLALGVMSVPLQAAPSWWGRMEPSWPTWLNRWGQARASSA